MTCIFAVPRGMPNVDNSPDNTCVSPKGGILLMEDGSSFQGSTVGALLMGVLSDGNAFAFAENNLTVAVRAQAAAQGKPGTSQGAAFAGGTFSPDGRMLFVDIYTPGITLAISGPWGAGPL